MSPNIGGGGELRGSQPMIEQLYTGAQINFGDLTPYLTYGRQVWYIGTADFRDSAGRDRGGPRERGTHRIEK
jgi:hypothetical protein